MTQHMPSATSSYPQELRPPVWSLSAKEPEAKRGTPPSGFNSTEDSRFQGHPVVRSTLQLLLHTTLVRLNLAASVVESQ